METSQKAADPFNRAILGVLQSIGETWRECDIEDLSGAQEKAVRLFVRAGLAEYRLSVRASHGDEEEEYSFRVSGDFDSELFEHIQRDHPDWDTNAIALNLSPVFELRLTTEGVKEKERISGEEGYGELCHWLRRAPCGETRVACEVEVVGPKSEQKEAPKPLTEQQQEAFNLIRHDGPLTGKQVVNALGISSESTFTRHFVPALRTHGIRNLRGLGYYHEDTYRPAD